MCPAAVALTPQARPFATLISFAPDDGRRGPLSGCGHARRPRKPPAAPTERAPSHRRRGPAAVDLTMNFAKDQEDGVIKMRQWPVEGTRTPGKSSIFEAECEVDGRRYSARSRHGAPNELARLLVSVGIADQPVEVSHAGIRGCITYRSLHDLARWTYQESAKVPLRRVRWKPLPDFSGDVRIRDAQNLGDSPDGVEEEPELP